MDGHYDRASDIVWLRFGGYMNQILGSWMPFGAKADVEQTAWGLIERINGQIVGLEYWDASTIFPAEVLEALPAPPANTIRIEQASWRSTHLG